MIRNASLLRETRQFEPSEPDFALPQRSGSSGAAPTPPSTAPSTPF